MASNNNEDVEIEKLGSQLQTLCKDKSSNEESIHNIERKLTVLLCPKGKNECEPAYCIFRITDNCEFLTKWRSFCKR